MSREAAATPSAGHFVRESRARKKNSPSGEKNSNAPKLAARGYRAFRHPPHATSNSQLIFAMRLDGHIRSRIRHTCEAEALLHLVVVQERLVRLIDGTRHHLARAAGAGAGAARVRQLDAFLLGLVQDVCVLWALKLLRAVRGLQGDLGAPSG